MGDQRVSDSEDEGSFRKVAEPGRRRTSTGNDGVRSLAAPSLRRPRKSRVRRQ
ncbi:hypothetical protein [Methanothrix harundinacea]|uniref:hypothetical protein n=1 Tax=Methanothrix harundinacea TaxID=301375 RepID=UPI0016510FA0|nr:hypothetical protein [Methanothrix harundinacea]